LFSFFDTNYSTIALQEEISRIQYVSSIAGERQDAIDHILAGISRLSNEVSDAADYIPAYDQRTYTQVCRESLPRMPFAIDLQGCTKAVKALSDKLNETTNKLAPRSRFQFKPRPQNGASTSELGARKNDPRRIIGGQSVNAAVSTDSVGESIVAHADKDTVGDLPTFPKNYNAEMARPGGQIRKPSFSAARDIAITEQNGLHIILPQTAWRATSSGSLTELEKCIVDMSVPTAGKAAFLSLAIKNIKKCLIIAGHVAGPAHLTGVSDSIIVVAARQVRIHECKNVDIYLHCTSHPIIEDCSGVRFAPIPVCYVRRPRCN
jgi:tubulin-specific chaperone C